MDQGILHAFLSVSNILRCLDNSLTFN